MIVNILLSTHNGESYIEDQIQSILAQSNTEWLLLIRDDLSQDSTPSLINKYKKLYPNRIKVIENENIRMGASQSFARLLELSDSQYIMFCDQDDVWLPQKVELTISKLQELESIHGRETPLLIHTDLVVVDSQLKLISNSLWKYQNLDPNNGNYLNRILVQNVVTGCTIALNNALKTKVIPIPLEAVMHDWWITLVAVTFGKVFFLKESTVMYRQHKSNDIGAKKWGFIYIYSRLVKPQRVRSYIRKTSIQANKFLESYCVQMSVKDRDFVEVYSSLGRRNFFLKRYQILKYGFCQFNKLRNIGLLIFI